MTVSWALLRKGRGARRCGGDGHAGRHLEGDGALAAEHEGQRDHDEQRQVEQHEQQPRAERRVIELRGARGAE
eukprot:4781393-Prymnesium_polylepis.2